MRERTAPASTPCRCCWPGGWSRRACRSSRSSGRKTRKLDKLCKSGGGWDTHGNNFNCLKDRLLPEFDRPFAALLDDLHQRGLLDTTLVLVTSEMGRKPKIGDPRSGGAERRGPRPLDALHVGPAGRRRHPRRAGLRHAPTSRPSIRPINPSRPRTSRKTVFHAMGIEDLDATDREGRPFHLLPEGAPIPFT